MNCEFIMSTKFRKLNLIGRCDMKIVEILENMLELSFWVLLCVFFILSVIFLSFVSFWLGLIVIVVLGFLVFGYILPLFLYSGKKS